MRILRLSFKNIASFRSETMIHIDFTKPPLSQHSLFLITGSTGAGKSTLLDAMTVALYNKYTREKSTNNFLSSLASNALIELEYEKDGTKYRNVWKINRSRDKIDGALQQSEMQLSLVESNEIIASKKTDVIQKTTEILGLDFEQFTKTIILPQGDFANFLHAKDEVKIELFEKITDTKKYREFSQFVYLRNKEEEAILSKIFDSIGNVEPLNQEDELILTNEIQQLKNDISVKKEEIQSINFKIQQLNSIKNLSTNLQSIESELSELISKKDYIETVEISISRAENANEIVSTIKNIKEQTTILHQKNEALQQNISKKSELELEFTLFQEQFQEISATFEQQKELVAQLYEKLPVYNDVKNRIQNLEEKIHHEENEYLINHNEYASNEKTILQLNESIDNDIFQKNTLINDLEELSYLDNAPIHIERLKSLQRELKNISLIQFEILNALEGFSNEIKEKSDEIILYETSIRENERKKFPHSMYSDITKYYDEQLIEFCKLYEEVKSKLEQINNYTQTIAELEEIVEISEKEYENVRADFQNKKEESELVTSEIATLQLEMKLHSFRSQLIEGQPCPLCGSLEHSLDEYNHSSDDILLNKIKSLQQQESMLEVTKFELQKNLNNIEQLQQQRCEAIEKNKLQIFTLQEENLQNKIELQLFPFPQNIETFHEIQEEILAREHNKFLQFQIDNGTVLIYRNRNEITKLNEKTKEFQLQIELRKNESIESTNAIEDIKSIYKFPNELTTDGFIQEVETVYNHYKSNLEKANTLDHKIAVSTSRLNTIKEGNQKLKFKIEDIHSSLERNKKVLSEIIVEKGKLFGVSDVEEEHKMAHQNLQILHSNLQSFEKQLQYKKAELANIDAQIVKINDEISHYIEPRIKELTTQKSLLTQLYNFSSDEEIYSLEIDSEVLLNKKMQVQEFKQNLANLLFDKKQKTIELENLLLSKPNETNEELQTLLHLVESKQVEITQELGAKNLLFFQNDEKKQQYAQHKTKYEHQKSITNRWSKLSSFIGSSDGKKYQRIVQRITMARLLEYTNLHLQEFSSRYSVSLFSSDNDGNNQSLDLLIQDNDNNGKLRQVSTLSGGETFLVSLSMALGIATMISSAIEVESLFLDEGFGTLDSHTLEMVMLALENLQQKGRKIGIISHVEQLKERISTQIVVQSLGNGTSRIFVREN